MIRKGPRRRLRIRRKRKGKSVASEVGRGARDAAGEAAVRGAVDETVEVVGEFGGCVVEAVGSAALLVAVLTVPAYLLIR